MNLVPVRMLSFAVVSCCFLAGVVRAGEGFTPLFNGKDLSGWQTIFRDGDKGDPKTGIMVNDGEIQVAGDPWGYLYTDKAYKNYVLRYSWRYPKEQPEK